MENNTVRCNLCGMSIVCSNISIPMYALRSHSRFCKPFSGTLLPVPESNGTTTSSASSKATNGLSGSAFVVQANVEPERPFDVVFNDVDDVAAFDPSRNADYKDYAPSSVTEDDMRGESINQCKIQE